MYISIQNSKTGPSFNLPAGNTCPGKTELCASLCYASAGRMGLPFQKARRDQNLDQVIQHLKDDPTGSSLADALDRQIKKLKIKTLRIHDSGDFFNPVYTRVWTEVVKRNPQVRFWAYTRSFDILTSALLDLALLNNMAMWISADMENWERALAVYREHSEWAGIAFMQTEGSEATAAWIQNAIGKGSFINFPLHGSRSGSKKLVVADASLRNCPVTTGDLKPDWTDPPCVRCGLCLPKAPPVERRCDHCSFKMPPLYFGIVRAGTRQMSVCPDCYKFASLYGRLPTTGTLTQLEVPNAVS